MPKRASDAATPAKAKKAKKAKPESVTTRVELTQPSAAPLNPFVIASWNVDGQRAPGRLDGLKRLVAEVSPDLVVLQETKLQEKHHADMAASIDEALDGAYDVWFCSSTAKKGYAGVAALTRKLPGSVPPMVDHVGTGATFASLTRESATPPTPSIASFFGGAAKAAKTAATSSASSSAAASDAAAAGRGRVVRVQFGTGDALADAEGRSVTVEYERFALVGLYVPNSGQKLERLEYRTETYDAHVAQYVEALEASSGKAVIVTGDLNVAHRDGDVHNHWATHLKKQPGCTAAERASFTKWLETSGRVDVLRALHGDAAAQYTYWSTRAKAKEPNKGLRLDYFIVKKALVAAGGGAGNEGGVRVHSTSIAHRGFGGANPFAPSDHAPVILTLELP
jgi:exodeoxyribonuclease III